MRLKISKKKKKILIIGGLAAVGLLLYLNSKGKLPFTLPGSSAPGSMSPGASVPELPPNYGFERKDVAALKPGEVTNKMKRFSNFTKT